MERVQQVLRTASNVVQSDEFEKFVINTQDFVSDRARGESVSTQLTQMAVSLSDAAEVLNRNFAKKDDKGRETTVISPVVMPKDHRAWGWLILALSAAVGWSIGGIIVAGITGLSLFTVFIPFWLMWFVYVGFNLWKNSFVMIPDGCVGLVYKYGKVEDIAPAGRYVIFHPWKKVSFIVNVTKEYPYNAPVREAPTSSKINASVDLFLQFKIKEPLKFVTDMGGVQGFSERLQNTISEVTRALIYSQRADEIYDLVGESTSQMLDDLNKNFNPIVEFVSANITHAEPSDIEYRKDLASAEMVRVAKEAYTYKYELDLRKKRDEGDLDKELASLRETLSEIRAEIGTSRAQMETAREKEINRANAYAQQLMVEAESEAHANAALLQAQALDIRAVKSADFPEILEYRYQQEVLTRIAQVADKLPQLVHIGDGNDLKVDFLNMASEMLGVENKPLYTDEDIAQIRGRRNEMIRRIQLRAKKIAQANLILSSEDDASPADKVEGENA